MKSKKIAAIVVVAVLLLGGYGTLRYVENVVVGKVRELEHLSSAKISFGEVRFSPLRRHLSLGDVHVEWGNDALRVVYDIRQAEGVLPLGLVRLLFDTPEGMTPILSEATLRDIKTSVPGSTTTVVEQRITDLRADLPELARLLESRPSDIELSLGISKNITYARSITHTLHGDIASQGQTPAVAYDLAGIRVEGYDKGDCALTEGSDVNITVQGIPMVSLKKLSIKDFRFPPEFTPQLLEGLEPNMEEARAREAGIKILKALFEGREPLFRQLQLQALRVTPPLIPPISLDALTLDWTSATPLKVTCSMDNLALPTRLLALIAPQITLPGLDMLHLDFKAALDGSADGTEQHRQTLTLRDVATLATDITVQNRPSLLADVAANAEYDRNFRLVRAEATLEDKRLLAYVGGNLKPGGVGATQILEQIAGTLVAQALEPQKATAVTAQLDSFIQKPGTLKIDLTPNQPVLWSLLRDDPRALSDLLNTDLHVEATPGPTPLEQEIRRLFMSDGK